MPRGKMSPEAKAKIAAAQRKRWAAHHAAKAAGTLTVKKKRGRPPGSTTGARRGRPPKGAAASDHNPFMNMTIHALVTARKNVEEAWNSTLAMLGMGATKRRRVNMYGKRTRIRSDRS